MRIIHTVGLIQIIIQSNWSLVIITGLVGSITNHLQAVEIMNCKIMLESTTLSDGWKFERLKRRSFQRHRCSGHRCNGHRHRVAPNFSSNNLFHFKFQDWFIHWSTTTRFSCRVFFFVIYRIPYIFVHYRIDWIIHIFFFGLSSLIY